MNPETRETWAVWAGVLGGLLFFAGDMLFYGHFGAGADFARGELATVRAASPERLMIGGLVGPPAAVLCAVGFWGVARRIEPPSSRLRPLVTALGVAAMVALGAVHALWTPRGFAMKYCAGDDAQCLQVKHAVDLYWSTAWTVGAAPAYAAVAVLGALMLLGRTRYPRWTALANPLIWYLLFLVLPPAPAPLGAVLAGGEINLAVTGFFLVAALTARGADRGGGAVR